MTPMTELMAFAALLVAPPLDVDALLRSVQRPAAGPDYSIQNEAQPWHTEMEFDVDGDGGPDIVVEFRYGHGALSTYWTERRLRACGDTHLLRGGAPLADGATLSLQDLLTTAESVGLCTISGCLACPDRSFEEFSSGVWWKQRAALGVAVIHAEQALIGHVVVNVSLHGEVSIEKGAMEAIRPATVPIHLAPPAVAAPPAAAPPAPPPTARP